MLWTACISEWENNVDRTRLFTSIVLLASLQDVPVTLPNVRDLIKISSASDDSVYFVWMSWSIWLSGKKSNNKPITRNLSQGNTNTRSSSALQHIMDWSPALFTASYKTISAHSWVWSDFDLWLVHHHTDSVASVNDMQLHTVLHCVFSVQLAYSRYAGYDMLISHFMVIIFRKLEDRDPNENLVFAPDG